ncbi:hypothetical protein RI367_002294 [Sorochytrium milnesiophthora]
MLQRPLYCCLVSLALIACVACNKSPQVLLEEGNAHFARGSLSDAISAYGQAINLDPTTKHAYYRRAVTYQALSQYALAIRDITKVLELEPSFHQAYLQRSRSHLRNGNFEEASADIKSYKDIAPSSATSDDDIKKLESEIDDALNHVKDAQRHIASKKHDEAISSLTAALAVAPSSAKFRLQRANEHLLNGAVDMATGDLTRVLRLTPTALDLYMRVARLQFYALYEPDSAIDHVRSCLASDPEHKECKKLFRKLKALRKRIDKAQKAVEGSSARAGVDDVVKPGSGMLAELDAEYKEGTAPEQNIEPRKLRLHLLSIACTGGLKLQDTTIASPYCKQLSVADKENAAALAKHGEALLLEEDFENAVNVLTRAFELSGQGDRSIQETLQRAQRLLQQSKKKDYYKVLGIKRTATKSEIKKAYRALAKQFHPDKYQGELTHEQVQSKFSQITEAYEVLSNDETRAKFDSGVDPNDQSGGGHGHGHPFAQFFQGGFPFGQAQGGSGGQQFQFKFEF